MKQLTRWRGKCSAFMLAEEIAAALSLARSEGVAAALMRTFIVTPTRDLA